LIVVDNPRYKRLSYHDQEPPTFCRPSASATVADRIVGAFALTEPRCFEPG
jgi:hypothetical protein